MIYLDNAATTQPIAELPQITSRHIESQWANPSALYPAAVEAEARMKAARQAVCSGLGAANKNKMTHVFTSCGSEANNQAIFSGWRPQGGKKLHFITSEYEHPCAYECFMALKAQGHSVDFLKPSADGTIHTGDLAAAVREDTALVSIMHVQNETGAINDIAALAAAAKRANPSVLFHSDGVQGFCKVITDMSGVDYYTCSAHKLHGLKGTGALFYAPKTPLKAFVLGGGQEGTLRSGTENTLGIEVFGEAVTRYVAHREEFIAHMYEMRSALLKRLCAIEGAYVISPENAAPHILNISFDGVRGEVLLHAVASEGVCISTGSACSSKKGKLSRVHTSLGLKKNIAEGAVRISLCPENTDEEIAQACDIIEKNVKQLRRFVRR